MGGTGTILRNRATNAYLTNAYLGRVTHRDRRVAKGWLARVADQAGRYVMRLPTALPDTTSIRAGPRPLRLRLVA